MECAYTIYHGDLTNPITIVLIILVQTTNLKILKYNDCSAGLT